MFRGGFEHNLDEKGRVIIPQKFRAKLGEKFIITKGLGGCIFVMTEDQWRTSFEDRFQAQPMLDPSTIMLERFFCSEAMDATADSQGRIAISAPLRDYAGIVLQSDVMIMGVTNRLEIWSRPRWDELNATLTQDALLRSAAEIGVGRTIFA